MFLQKNDLYRRSEKRSRPYSTILVYHTGVKISRVLGKSGKIVGKFYFLYELTICTLSTVTLPSQVK